MILSKKEVKTLLKDESNPLLTDVLNSHEELRKERDSNALAAKETRIAAADSLRAGMELKQKLGSRDATIANLWKRLDSYKQRERQLETAVAHERAFHRDLRSHSGWRYRLARFVLGRLLRP